MALTADIKTIRYGTDDGHAPTSKPLGASVTVYGGSIAITDSAGNVKNAASPASTDVTWGLIAEQRPFPPLAASSTAGTYQVEILTGSFFLASGTSSDALTAADLGKTVYVIDEKTVGKTSNGNTRPVAGVLMAIDTTVQPSYAVKLGNSQSTGSP